jgi:hypothetical protein
MAFEKTQMGQRLTLLECPREVKVLPGVLILRFCACPPDVKIYYLIGGAYRYEEER